MSTLLSSAFLLAFIAMALTYPMYFLELSAFGKIMTRDHPDLVGQQPLSLSDSYRLLQRVQSGRFGGIQLSAEALLAHKRTKRLLYIAMSLFMVVLFIGLAEAVLSKPTGLAEQFMSGLALQQRTA